MGNSEHYRPNTGDKKKNQIINLTLPLVELGKKQQIKHKVSTRKEKIKIRAEITETEFKKNNTKDQ